jgi:uncharacterized protein
MWWAIHRVAPNHPRAQFCFLNIRICAVATHSTLTAIVTRMKSIALLAIRGYQRFISPYKGFRCAYGLHSGRCTCSGLGYRAIRRYGVLDGLSVLRERLTRCGQVHRMHLPKSHALSKQAGVCDVGCIDVGGCDAPSGSTVFNVCSCLDCGSFGGSKPRLHERKKSNERKEVFVNSR